MATWSLDDIPWHTFDASKAAPELISLVKAACMVEYNGKDYARYLREVFADAPELYATIDNWAEEEVQHGQALRKWAELADPAFNFDESFKAFTTGYQLPTNVTASVRGSRTGEWIARCVVETGTSNYYTAITEYTEEPVLKAVCARIAADEFRHYKLFYSLYKQYQQKEGISLWKRISIALGRVAESDDDELSYAFYTAHMGIPNQPAYDRKLYAKRYFQNVGRLYRRKHTDQMMAMIFKAIGFKPHTPLYKVSSAVAWNAIKWQARA